MAINVSIPTTAAQDAKLAKLLVRVNEARAAEGKPPHATFDAYALAVIIEAVKSWVREQDGLDAEALRTAYDNATPAQQAAARTALGL